MATTVRTAHEDDLPEIARLHALLQRLHAERFPERFRTDAEATEITAFFATVLFGPDSLIAVAELDGALVGFLCAEFVNVAAGALMAQRRHAYVFALSVADDMRRQGVGSALIAFAERQAAIRGAEEIVLDTWSDSVETRHFYEACGFSEYTVMLRLPVERMCAGDALSIH